MKKFLRLLNLTAIVLLFHSCHSGKPSYTYAVHSGPEPKRHFFDARPDERDFRETYLPQFEMGIKEGKAYSVMCAYNRLHGEACCGSSHLFTTILRKEWNFPGYVVSECGATFTHLGDAVQKNARYELVRHSGSNGRDSRPTPVDSIRAVTANGESAWSYFTQSAKISVTN